ncbi:MAG: single-stranded DNA-binding protein, partial [Acidimicrobiia bacterium]
CSRQEPQTNEQEEAVNKTQLIGRLTKDPELRYTPSGMATTTVRLAVPRRKRNGEEQPPVYIDVVTFDKQAEAVAEYLAKGRRVAVSGRLEYREWQSQQDGSMHSKHEVIADEIEFLDPKDKAPANGSTEPAYAAGEEPF